MMDKTVNINLSDEKDNHENGFTENSGLNTGGVVDKADKETNESLVALLRILFVFAAFLLFKSC